MTSRVGKVVNSQSGFADWIEARAARQGRRDCGFADGIEAAPGHPWPARHSRILRISGAARQGRRDSGFTYTVVLIMLIALGLSASAATQLGSQRMLAEREVELLFRGLAYQRAIKSYYEAVPPNVPTLPRQLEDLLKDPRVQHRRHLRALYPDPFAPAGDTEGWRVLRAEDGGILGVVSRSLAEPRRQANFPRGLEGLAGARTHADWQFVFTPPPRAVSASPLRGTPQVPTASTTR